MTYYTIKAKEISEGGRDLNASTSTDEWLKRVIEDAISGEFASYDANLTAKISKIEQIIEVTGGIYLKMNVKCDLCASDFVFEQQIPFRIILEPAEAGNEDAVEDEDVSEVDDAIDFSYYTGDEIDIGDIIRQHVIMDQPIRHICKEDCKGLCPTCGKNLNEGPCDCVEKNEESPFAVLKDFGNKRG